MEYLPQPKSPAPPAVVPPAETVYAGPYPDAAFQRDEDDDGSVILEYLRILRRHKGVVVTFAVLGLALGVAATVLKTPVYRASTTLEVLSLNQDFLNMKQSSPVTETNEDYDTSEVETQVKILQNQELRDRVVAKLDPQAKPREQAAVPASRIKSWRDWFKPKPPSALSPRDQLLLKAADSLKVTATPRTRVMEATVDSTDPQLAADFANTLDEQFIDQNLEAREQVTERMGTWLGRELGDARAKLAQSEDALQAYAAKSGLIFTQNDSSLATEKLQQIQIALSAATADRIAKQSRFELAQHAPPDALPDVLDDTNYRLGQAKLNDLHSQVADLSAIYNPQYGKLKEAQAQAATLQAALDRQRTDILGKIKNEYDDAVRKENLLASSYDSQTREVTGQDEKAIQYNILKREVDSNRQLYDTMLQQMKGSSIASAMTASNIRIVDRAQVPSAPNSPSLPVDSAVGLLLGFFSGVGLVLIRERADRTLQQPGDAQFWTNLPELGVIPSAKSEARALGYGYAKVKVVGETPDRKVALTVGKSKDHVELVTFERGPSFIAEAFRTVLTSILFIGENGSSPRVLVFTSAAAGDGKTTIVTNLGIALAEIGRRVLIIDADLRRPRQHTIFNIQNGKGLSSLLKSLEPDPEGWADSVQETKVPGLWLLPSGPATQAAANLLYSPRMSELLAAVKRQYDMVLIDTPPMLQMTDARVLGRLVDAAILVARAEKTTRDALLAATKRFAEDRIRVLGTILNDWNPKRSPNGYYGYYRGRYYSKYTYDSRSPRNPED